MNNNFENIELIINPRRNKTKIYYNTHKVYRKIF